MSETRKILRIVTGSNQVELQQAFADMDNGTFVRATKAEEGFIGMSKWVY